MSNTLVFSLPCLEVEIHQVREVARCLLHTLIFNRALGPLEPLSVDSELFDICWVNCGDDTVNKKVEGKIAQFHTWVERNPGKKGQICLSFFETKARPAWFTRSEQRLYWEQWYLNFQILETGTAWEESNTLEAETVRAQRKERLQSDLEAAIATIVRTVNEKKDHIPPVVSSAAVTFPFDISIAGESGPSFGLDLVRRMLSSTNPPSVLH